MMQRSLFKAVRATALGRPIPTTARRCFASSSVRSAEGTLPLEGVRVLDMTRVLAGVRRRSIIHAGMS